MIIGKFEASEHGYHGYIQTLFGDVGCVLIPQAKGADFSVTTDNACELGAAWKKSTKSGTTYLSVRLDGPFLPAPVNCALFPAKHDTFDLIWKRQADDD
jgi:uncharacterized protein (DUF736 family)